MISLKSYAKLNLYLHLLAKNQHGYHLLDSLFCYIDLYDEIEIMESLEAEHQINANYQLDLTNNLIYKALELFSERYLVKQKFTINHHKNIPMAAGLGGGSSNAAVILNYLYKYYKINCDLDEKIEVAKSLGSDVPFFLTNKTRYVGGIGEKLGEECKICELPIIIIKPNEGLSTKQVFANIKMNDYSGALTNYPKDLSNKDNLLKFLKVNNNDLKRASVSMSKALFGIFSLLEGNNKVSVKMTGSGPTCFIIPKEQEMLDDIYEEIVKKFPDYLVLKSKLLNGI